MPLFGMCCLHGHCPYRTNTFQKVASLIIITHNLVLTHYLVFAHYLVLHIILFLSIWRDLLHRGDRAMIYLFIAGSYTPWLNLRQLDGEEVIRVSSEHL